MTNNPPARLHHAHLMASSVDQSIAFFRDVFGGEVVADESLAGARNVLIDVGGGRVNLYDRPPNDRGPVNHLGIQVADLDDAVRRLVAAGYEPRPIKVDGPLSYSMVEGPDGLLFEIFHFDDSTPTYLKPYFDLE